MITRLGKPPTEIGWLKPLLYALAERPRSKGELIAEMKSKLQGLFYPDTESPPTKDSHFETIISFGMALGLLTFEGKEPQPTNLSNVFIASYQLIDEKLATLELDMSETLFFFYVYLRADFELTTDFLRRMETCTDDSVSNLNLQWEVSLKTAMYTKSTTLKERIYLGKCVDRIIVDKVSHPLTIRLQTRYLMSQVRGCFRRDDHWVDLKGLTLSSLLLALTRDFSYNHELEDIERVGVELLTQTEKNDQEAISLEAFLVGVLMDSDLVRSCPIDFEEMSSLAAESPEFLITQSDDGTSLIKRNL